MLSRKNLGAAIGILALICLFAATSLAAPQAKIKQTPMSAEKARMIDGKDTYVALCASCHGPDGAGAGPVAKATKMAVPDITDLAKRSGGKFPAAQVLTAVQGDVSSVGAHGTTDMPVWGTTFRQSQGDALAMLRMYNLVNYLESIQK